jgi:hypothetical protein
MAFQSTTKFPHGLRWVLGSLLFIADKFKDLSLHEPELPKVTGSGTVRLPPTLVRVHPVNEAHLRHGSSEPGEVGLDPLEGKVDHHRIRYAPHATDPFYQPPSGFNCRREVYMVALGEQLTEKTTKEITWEAEEEFARAAQLAREVVKGKKAQQQVGWL